MAGSRAEIVTLQDLLFVVDKANTSLGLVSATKLSGYALNQLFFAALSQSMFLAAHQI